MHRTRPFRKPVNVIVVEDAGLRQLGGRMILVCHATYVARPMRAIKPKPPGAALIRAPAQGDRRQRNATDMPVDFMRHGAKQSS